MSFHLPSLSGFRLPNCLAHPTPSPSKLTFTQRQTPRPSTNINIPMDQYVPAPVSLTQMQTCPLIHRKYVSEKEQGLPHPTERGIVQKEVSLFFPLEKSQTFGEKIGQNEYKEER